MQEEPTMAAAELEKLQAEVEKLKAEVKKLNAESGKLYKESILYPAVVAAGLMTAGAALMGAAGVAITLITKYFAGA